MLGTSGSTGDRWVLITASARSLPTLICGTVGGSELNNTGVCPPIAEPTAGPAPLNGTCTRSRPNESRNCSPTRCGGVPTPGEAKLYLPGCALISETSSWTEVAAIDGWTASTVADVTAIVTGSKSR